MLRMCLKNADFSDGIQLVLKNGNRYEEVRPKRADRRKKRYPHSRVSFGTYTMNIDLRDFNNVDVSETRVQSWRDAGHSQEDDWIHWDVLKRHLALFGCSHRVCRW